MNWMPFNAAVNAITCCAGLAGVAWGLGVGNYLFAAILAVVAIVSGYGVVLRVWMLRRNRRLRSQRS